MTAMEVTSRKTGSSFSSATTTSRSIAAMYRSSSDSNAEPAGDYLRYEHTFRNGKKDSTEWGDTTLTDGFGTRNMVHLSRDR